MRVVCKHTDTKWLLLYIERWLKAPVQVEDGTICSRGKGSPQGSVISPLLANLFLPINIKATAPVLNSTVLPF